MIEIDVTDDMIRAGYSEFSGFNEVFEDRNDMLARVFTAMVELSVPFGAVAYRWRSGPEAPWSPPRENPTQFDGAPTNGEVQWLIPLYAAAK